MINNRSAPLPSLTYPNRAEETQSFQFDYKYATPSEIQGLTKSQLIKLEMELHNLRLAYVAHGMNDEAKVNPTTTISKEIERVETLISNVENYFGSVLSWTE